VTSPYRSAGLGRYAARAQRALLLTGGRVPLRRGIGRISRDPVGSAVQCLVDGWRGSRIVLALVRGARSEAEESEQC